MAIRREQNLSAPGLQGALPSFPVRNPHGFLHGITKILPSRSFRSWRLGDGFTRRADRLIRHDHFYFYFRDQLDDILGSAVDFFVPLLAAESPDFGYGHTLHGYCAEAAFTSSIRKRFDDRFHLFHGFPPKLSAECGSSLSLILNCFGVFRSFRPDPAPRDFPFYQRFPLFLKVVPGLAVLA